jgi:hypothetical protein
LGLIAARLPEFTQPQELTLELRMAGSEIANSWRIWVYPAVDDTLTQEGILVAEAWTPTVKKTLQSGGRVLLMPNKESVRDGVDIRFWTVFWGRGLFPHLPRPMGIFCDPADPALAWFPTREHSDWQWNDLLTDAYALNLNELPFEYEPVVHVIDDFNLSHRLGVILEAKVGQGTLLISTLNLGTEGQRSLSQRNMLNNLLTRVTADDFKPVHSISVEQLEKLFREP